MRFFQFFKKKVIFIEMPEGYDNLDYFISGLEKGRSKLNLKSSLIKLSFLFLVLFIFKGSLSLSFNDSLTVAVIWYLAMLFFLSLSLFIYRRISKRISTKTFTNKEIETLKANTHNEFIQLVENQLSEQYYIFNRKSLTQVMNGLKQMEKELKK